MVLRLRLCIVVWILLYACHTSAAGTSDGPLPIPVIRIYTENKAMPTCTTVKAPEGCWGVGITNNNYVNGRMTVSMGDSTVYDSGEYVENTGGTRQSGMRIRIRGNTSTLRRFPPYHIKLSQKSDPLHFGYEKKTWNLIRPLSAWSKRYYLLDNCIGREVAILAGMTWQPQYKFVELYLNDDYRGLYLLSDAVERGSNRIETYKTGFIAEADAYWWNEPPEYQFRTPMQVPQLAYTFKYPEAEDFDTHPEWLSDIESYFNTIEDSLYSGSKELGRYLDMPSFAAWHWAHDLLGTRDTGGSNMFFHKEDLQPTDPFSSPLHIGPLWDFDSSFASDVTRWCDYHYRNYSYGNELFKREDFLQLYTGLCEERLSVACERVEALIDSLQSTFGDNIEQAIKRHNKRCSEQMPSFVKQAEFINTWFANRTQWMADNYYTLIDNLSDGIKGTGGSSPTYVYSIDGRLVRTIPAGHTITGERLPAGTYIIRQTTPNRHICKIISLFSRHNDTM